MRSFDALVVGAGPAGSIAALALARAGRRVAIVEKEAFPRRKVCGEFVSSPTWALLRELGVESRLAAEAGPPVHRVGLYARDDVIEAPMPARAAPAGRAVGRHRLDAALLEAAVSAGAVALQPAEVESLARDPEDHQVVIAWPRDGTETVRARLIVDAHGSWLRSPFGELPPPTASDLLGFKARFTDAALPRGLMPLVLFPGGYGGLVEAEAGVVSFSCCIRRDALRRARAGGVVAGDAVRAHVAYHCRGFREVLAHARLEGPWLAAGPIRPGFRRLCRDHTFAVGNAAGEAHPLIAEGISMAIQSGWLLARHLTTCSDARAAGQRYARAWQRQFAVRIRAAEAFMRMTASAPAAAFSLAAVRRFPAALTLGAWWSGKVRALEATAA